MFVPNSNGRRVIIVDFMHLAYSYAFGCVKKMTTSVQINGSWRIIDVTMLNGIVKQMNKWTKNGFNPIVFCFDMSGANKSRKMYFQSLGEYNSDGSIIGYKQTRGMQDRSFHECVDIVFNTLHACGVCCLRHSSYEADDLIMATVQKSKELFPDLPIDIITGDQDLLPLVDDQVSVFIKSKTMTWAESKDLEKLHYVQVTPYNFQDYVQSLTDFKNLPVPYNTVLLKKLLRGKKSDNIPALPKMTPTKYKNIVYGLMDDGYDLDDLFRYDTPTYHYRNKITGEIIPDDKLSEVPLDEQQFVLDREEPEALTYITEALSNYLNDEELDYVRKIYNGINLNGAFINIGTYNRKPAKLVSDIKGYNPILINQYLSKNYKFDVNLY